MMPELSTAVFSEDRVHRYSLTREVSPRQGVCVVCMLNPSTADERRNDPSVNRCIHFAKALLCGKLIVVNLFAFRATDTAELKRENEEMGRDIIGPANDQAIISAMEQATVPIVAWGNHGTYLKRGDAVLEMLKGLNVAPLYAFKLTKLGQPIHPLYLPDSAHRSMVRMDLGWGREVTPSPLGSEDGGEHSYYHRTGKYAPGASEDPDR